MVPDADVVAVPYDSRLGVLAAAERLEEVVVSARLAGVSEADGAARLIIVAHSMGGVAGAVAGRSVSADDLGLRHRQR